MAEKINKKRGDERRQALVQAAAQSVWLDGYAASSLATIAARADVPIGNVYYYFKTKADIADAVGLFFVAQTQALIDDICAAEADPKARLALLLARLRTTHNERVAHGCPIQAAVRGFRKQAPNASKAAAASFDLLAQFIAGEFKKSGMRPSMANNQARGIVAMWQGGIALAYAMEEPLILAETFQRIEKMMGHH